MKKLINDPADVVTEALRGHRRRPPGAAGRPQHRIVYRGDAPVRARWA